MKNPTIKKDEHGVSYAVSTRDNDFFSVGDLKKFLIDNNVPDDAALQICYESCCDAFPSKLLYDVNTNELVVVE